MLKSMTSTVSGVKSKGVKKEKNHASDYGIVTLHS